MKTHPISTLQGLPACCSLEIGHHVQNSVENYVVRFAHAGRVDGCLMGPKQARVNCPRGFFPSFNNNL